MSLSSVRTQLRGSPGQPIRSGRGATTENVAESERYAAFRRKPGRTDNANGGVIDVIKKDKSHPLPTPATTQPGSDCGSIA